MGNFSIYPISFAWLSCMLMGCVETFPTYTFILLLSVLKTPSIHTPRKIGIEGRTKLEHESQGINSVRHVLGVASLVQRIFAPYT